MDTPTTSVLLRDAEQQLAAAGIETARLDGEVLLATVAATDRAGLYARLRDPVLAADAERFRQLVARRAQREPLAYIVGHKEFYSLDFVVTPAVLIPRPETEQLVEVAAAHVGARPHARVCDVGTGSGCVAVALAQAVPAVRIVASDISSAALRIARQNAEQHGVADRIDFVAGDLLEVFAGVRFDAIVSNPPYLRPGDARSPELDWEPQTALAAGADGLAAIARLIALASALLDENGLLAIEIGADQGENAMALACAAGFEAVCVKPDLAGIPRVLIGFGVRRASGALSPQGARANAELTLRTPNA